jgi:uncharacterized Zn finger protein
VAASLYGVGAKLDQNPALLFLLRGVDPADLISKASAAEAVRQTTGKAGAAPAMSETEVADVFGIELAPATAISAPAVEAPAPAPSPVLDSPPAPKRKAPEKRKAHRRISPAMRARLAAATKARWTRATQTAKKKSGKK